MICYFCEECNVEMTPLGDGDWECPQCGQIVTIGDTGEKDDGALSVYEAAEIWASHGKDEDYTFGYSDEELEAAL